MAVVLLLLLLMVIIDDGDDRNHGGGGVVVVMMSALCQGLLFAHQILSMESCTAVSNMDMRPSRKSSCLMNVSMVKKPFDRAWPRLRLNLCSSHSAPCSNSTWGQGVEVDGQHARDNVCGFGG